LINNSIHSLDHFDSKNKIIDISTKLLDEKVIIFIKDNGKGISADDQDKIFDPFFSTKSPGEGMGLGLAIVKNFIKEIKGEIKCVPSKTRGALFEITLPLSNGKNYEDIDS
jgi:signal transduction histidine kinase